MAFTQDRRAKIGIGGRRMKNENPRHGGNVAGPGDSNEQTHSTTPPRNDQQNHSTLHVPPTCAPSNAGRCLVAVALRCKEFDELAVKILPATPAVFGGQWFYLTNGEVTAEKFADAVSGETIIEIHEATDEFANVGGSQTEIDELLGAVARLAAHSLGKRHCEGVIDGDDESLI